MKLNCVDCQLKSKPFRQLTDEQLRKVDDHRAELTFRKGELLLKQDSLISHIVFIREGFAKVFHEQGDESVVYGIATPGSFIGTQLLFGQSKFPFSVEALTDTEVCLKDIGVFKELLLENPKFSKGVIEHLGKELNQAYQRMFSLTNRQVDARFSELLLFMQKVMYRTNPFKLSISKKDLANLISTSPENLSRLISDFKHQGIIKSQGNTMEILDGSKLESKCLCDFHSMSRGI